MIIPAIPQSKTDQQKLVDAENEIRELRKAASNLKDKISDLEDELSSCELDSFDTEKAAAVQTIIDRIHYTTPGLKHVLLAGGAYHNDVHELLKTLGMPYELE